MDLTRFIRPVPDFPKPGILFRDITPLLADPAALAATLAWLDDAPGITGQLFALADADVTAPG